MSMIRSPRRDHARDIEAPGVHHGLECREDLLIGKIPLCAEEDDGIGFRPERR